MKQQIIYLNKYTSPLGEITLASDSESLIGLWFESQLHYAEILKKEETKYQDLDIFEKTNNWLNIYFNKQNPKIEELKLNPIGNNFRKTVWKNLCEIPYGKTSTYKEIAIKTANDLNKEKISAQAVGNAIGNNPISIIIPCHRVIGSNGKLTGYSGGLELKAKLLELESNPQIQ